jgi:hypothetical protein
MNKSVLINHQTNLFPRDPLDRLIYADAIDSIASHYAFKLGSSRYLLNTTAGVRAAYWFGLAPKRIYSRYDQIGSNYKRNNESRL